MSAREPGVPVREAQGSRDDGSPSRGGIGWFVLLLIFFIVAATPFVITAIVMLNR